jgi:type II secretory pathway component PulJ
MADITGQRNPIDGDEGLSLIELMITMIIFTLAIGMIFTAIVRVQTYTSNVASSADASSELRQALAEIDRQVRSGNVLGDPATETLTTCVSGIGTCFQVYTQSNGSPRCVRWEVTTLGAAPGTRVLRTRNWSPDWETGGSVVAWRVEARGLAPTQTTAPFALPSSGVLKVYLEALDPRRPTARVPITSSLFGRNSNYGYASGVCSPAPPG